MHSLNMHAHLSFGVRCLDLGLNVHLLTNSGCANSKGYGEPVQVHRLTRAFTVCLCDKYQNLVGFPRERSGTVVECLTRDRGAAGSSLTGVTALWSLSKTHLSLLSTGST